MHYQIIKDAINNKKVLEFIYNNQSRIVEPYELGMTSKNKSALLAIQIGGCSDSGTLPDWRMYDLNLIQNLKVNDRKFLPHFKVDK